MGRISVAIVSDVHYASAAERARGNEFEFRGLDNPLLRMVLRWHRRHVWLRDPLSQNHLLDAFIRQAAGCDYVVANGDYTCNTGFVGVQDDAACESVRECLGKLRRAFGPAHHQGAARFHATVGDHELGKVSFVGNRGGMRLGSWSRTVGELGVEPFWQFTIGRYRLVGVASSVLALPVLRHDTLPDERPAWDAIRGEHLFQVRSAFESVREGERLILFCHDPTALPFLLEERAVRTRLPQLELTVIGHLHTRLVLRLARHLAGMPQITWLGHTARRLSMALGKARDWQDFRVQLCPSLAGSELLKDGGWARLVLDPAGTAPAQFIFHPLWRG